MRFTVYRTDKGSLDKGGLPQPSFLNFDAKLLHPPAHALQVRRAHLQEVTLILLELSWPEQGAGPRKQELTARVGIWDDSRPGMTAAVRCMRHRVGLCALRVQDGQTPVSHEVLCSVPVP